ncbi:MAG: hypothetical protein JW801_01185 [Bacteroidales bacterium]|nr:hypothetical protein [Bacteroidales bacterium]
MKKISHLFYCLILLSLAGSLNAQADIPELIREFCLSDWSEIKNAKTELENLEGKAIPEILSLLENDEFVKLTNYKNLIYPGADNIYGYGQIIDYNIDNLSIRAGWLLEDLTFSNFGFSGIHLPEESQIPFIRITFPDYYNNATNRKKIESSSSEELSRLIHKLSIKAAKDWWGIERDDWSRLDALEDALKSFDEKRQVKALFYIRNGKTRCTGLTKDYYYENISQEIVRLSGSETLRVAEHARLILFDTKLTWLNDKQTD